MNIYLTTTKESETLLGAKIIYYYYVNSLFTKQVKIELSFYGPEGNHTFFVRVSDNDEGHEFVRLLNEQLKSGSINIIVNTKG